MFARLVCMEFAYLHIIVGLAWAHPRMHTLINRSQFIELVKAFSLCHIHRSFSDKIPLGGTMIGGQVAR